MEETLSLMRQGDVLIIRVPGLPAQAQPQPGLVLARGEETGHAHRLTAGRLYGASGVLYFSVDAPVLLLHEEHAALSIAPGVYEVRRQREYFPQRLRTVGD